MRSNIETLKSMMNAWKNQDVEGVLSHIHEDITWSNTGGLKPAVQGKAKMRAALQGMASTIKETHWRLFDWAEVGDKVWMEGVDEFINKQGIRVAVPYAGVLEFKDGVILKWREYYEGRLIEQMLAGQGVSAAVEAMLDRPVA